MTGRGRAALVAAMFVAAVAGAGAGRLLPERDGSVDLSALVTHRLGIDANQRRRVAALDQGYDVAHRRLLLQLRADDAALALAYRAQPGGGERVKAAVARVAADVSACQQAFVDHVVAVRGVLTPAQAATYDQAVVKALSDT